MSSKREMYVFLHFWISSLLSLLQLANAQYSLAGYRQCFPNIAPDNPGHCVLRNHLSRKCSNLLSTFSSDCFGKELCCFDPFMTLPTTVITTPIPTTTTATTTTTTQAPYRFCIPDTGPAIPNGICRAPSLGCEGLSVSTSRNCLQQEVCCYINRPLEPLTTIAGVVSSTVAITTTTAATTTTTATEQPTTAPPPIRSCSPGSYAAITNGLCVSSSKISQLCKGKQISPSLDCFSGEYCCFFADQPVGAGFYQQGLSCSPESNPMIGSGTCVDARQKDDQCEAMLWSRSRNCERGQICCYPASAGQRVTQASSSHRT